MSSPPAGGNPSLAGPYILVYPEEILWFVLLLDLRQSHVVVAEAGPHAFLVLVAQTCRHPDMANFPRGSRFKEMTITKVDDNKCRLSGTETYA